jgi:hypothetical protein
MLADDMRGKAVRVDPHGTLGVGKQIDLAVGLLDRMANRNLSPKHKHHDSLAA